MLLVVSATIIYFSGLIFFVRCFKKNSNSKIIKSYQNGKDCKIVYVKKYSCNSNILE